VKPHYNVCPSTLQAKLLQAGLLLLIFLSLTPWLLHSTVNSNLVALDSMSNTITPFSVPQPIQKNEGLNAIELTGESHVNVTNFS